MWMSLIPWSRSAARIGQVWPPLTANRYFTPWDWSTRATSAPPSILTAVEGTDSAAPSPAKAALAVFPMTTPESDPLELPGCVMVHPFQHYALDGWRTCSGELGAEAFRWQSSAFRPQQ